MSDGERARGFLGSGCAIVVVVFVEGRGGCESRCGETRGGVKEWNDKQRVAGKQKDENKR